MSGERIYFENGFMVLDLHACTREEARAVLDAQIPHASVPQLKIIHGFNQGHSLRDLVRGSHRHKRISRRSPGLNDGVTIYYLK